mmetsp:Transcript_26246/g.63950  ORF Transcript_26246/g.63950 Transcript_26246/m.63950 type:complete len:145 (+) Transcript_26246:2498-2932(+)|eukprot:CAMPEP_0113621306 /NCGR_PEP_ID=MMETSP0017_2-20120614/10882_1 /TAXON_ID=2856 /ORGANISM="Cylindrotheca closterium" /LENGTH=144 /DNA_ID=CAMNT_0000531037 /DNA_START=103 /DNA_END=537 /DNA_ORIENTATION=- /assembly_acc=CAM_ASM_000147
MAVDKRDFKRSCLKEAEKQPVSKRRGASILKRLRYTKTPQHQLSSRKEELPTPRRIDFEKPFKNRIHFYNKVQVVYIPSRDHYPAAMKSTIWSNAAEIRLNARRNTIEFAAEGWDWRRCCEDEAMFLSPQGERIHPVHFRQCCS